MWQKTPSKNPFLVHTPILFTPHCPAHIQLPQMQKGKGNVVFSSQVRAYSQAGKGDWILGSEKCPSQTAKFLTCSQTFISVDVLVIIITGKAQDSQVEGYAGCPLHRDALLKRQTGDAYLLLARLCPLAWGCVHPQEAVTLIAEGTFSPSQAIYLPNCRPGGATLLRGTLL